MRDETFFIRREIGSERSDNRRQGAADACVLNHWIWRNFRRSPRYSQSSILHPRRSASHYPPSSILHPRCLLPCFFPVSLRSFQFRWQGNENQMRCRNRARKCDASEQSSAAGSTVPVITRVSSAAPTSLNVSRKRSPLQTCIRRCLDGMIEFDAAGS